MIYSNSCSLRFFIPALFSFIQLLLFRSDPASAQKVFAFHDFSPNYQARAFLSDTSQSFCEAWIAVFDRKSGKEIIKVSIEEMQCAFLQFPLRVCTTLTGAKDQYLMYYDDFNFDGQKDFALLDGHNSGYLLPSYQIFLNTPNGFIENPSFTALAQEGSGMFDMDEKAKTIMTFSKSGYDFTRASVYMVKQNKPVPVHITDRIVDSTHLVIENIQDNLVNGQMQRTITKEAVFDIPDEQAILSFKTADQFKVLLFDYEGNLVFMLFNANNHVLHYYCGNFSLISAPGLLRFHHKHILYELNQEKLLIKTGNKVQEYVAASAQKKTDAGKIRALQLGNVR